MNSEMFNLKDLYPQTPIESPHSYDEDIPAPPPSTPISKTPTQQPVNLDECDFTLDDWSTIQETWRPDIYANFESSDEEPSPPVSPDLLEIPEEFEQYIDEYFY